MNKLRLPRFDLKFAIMAAFSLLSAEIAGAQTYYTSTNGDVVAGFRKTGTFVENNQLIVTLGNITNLLKLSVGATIISPTIPTSRFTNMAPDNLANLQWSVFAGIQRQPGIHENPWVTPLGSIPAATIWGNASKNGREYPDNAASA